MKCCGTSLMIGALSLAMLSPGARANTPTVPAFPYQGITDRNSFGLKPPPPNVPPEPPKPPVPDIILNGITTILGNKRALLKVPAKPPQTPKEEFYILTEGQRENEIEVITIDETAGTVSVRNHGTLQTLDFANNGPKVAGGPPAPRTPVPPAAAANIRQIPRQIRPPPTPPSSIQSAASPNPNPNYAPPANISGQPDTAASFNRNSPGFIHGPDYGIGGDEQTLLIEAQRAKLMEEGRMEEANMFPITDLTPAPGQSLFTQ